MREQHTDTQNPPARQDVATPPIPLIDISRATNDDDIRALALAALDEVRDVVEELNDDPVSASRAAALRQQAEKVRSDVKNASPGNLPRDLVNRVNACIREVGIARTEATIISTRSHSFHKADLEAVATTQREAETAIKVSIANNERRAVEEARVEREATEARQARRAAVVAGVVVAGSRDSIVSGAKRATVETTRRLFGGGAAQNVNNFIEAGQRQVDVIVDRTVESSQAMAAGAQAIGSGEIGATRKAADDSSRLAGDNLRSIGVAEPVATWWQDTQRGVTSNVGILGAMAVGSVRGDADQRAYAREQAAKAASRNFDPRAAAADARAMTTSLGRGINRVWEPLQDNAELRRLFDTNGDNRAKLHEVVEVLRDRYGITRKEQLDLNGDGQISVAEIRNAVFRKEVEQSLREAGQQGRALQGNRNGDQRVTLDEAIIGLRERGVTSISSIDTAAELQSSLARPVRGATPTRGPNN